MPLRGSGHFFISYRLTCDAFLASVFLLVCLVARPTPMGTPFVVEWHHYLARGVLLEALVTFSLASPFLLFWLAGYRRLWRWETSRWVHVVLAVILSLNIALNQFDHEIMRFMGTHATTAFLETYWVGGAWWSMIADSLWLDLGGPLLSVVLILAVPGLFILWVRHSCFVMRRPVTREWSAIVALIALVVPIVIPLAVHVRGTALGRTRRMKPYLMTVAEEWSWRRRSPTPADQARLAADYQRRWLDESGGAAWRFPDPRRPFVREPVRPLSPDAGERWNVIVIQLETFRAWNMGLLREHLERSPTPFIDSLAKTPEGAYWTRHFGFGLSTANAFMAWQCSIKPHSAALVASTFAYTNLYCLPEALRKHRYRAEVFLNGDPDWDNQRIWFQRWYDSYVDVPGKNEVDRPLFRAAAARIRALGRSGQPFLASILSSSNHHPFRSQEPQLDIARSHTPAERILNTMHYVDDVVREFVEGLSGEPFWNRTLLVMLGDHGYNLGERPNRSGQLSLFRESTWVPLIIMGSHPKLLTGRHDVPSSLLDVAPTVASLLGIVEPNPWQGHDLTQSPRPLATAGFSRESLAFAETARLSVVGEHDIGAVHVFDPAKDPLQQHPLSDAALAAEAARALEVVEAARRLNDHAIETNRIW
jgi:hypothetical protein